LPDTGSADWLRLDYYPAGAELIRQGGRTGSLIVLKDGEAEVLRDGEVVFSTRQPGAVFGEISVLLDLPHSATVRAVTDIEVFVIDDALLVLEAHPPWLMQIARLLAQRVNTTTEQLVAERTEEGRRDLMVLPERMFAAWADPQV
jgi:CRP-like cAMP-binding protein